MSSIVYFSLLQGGQHPRAGAALYPKIDWCHQLEYAETRGLGTRRYQLVTLEDVVA